MSNITSSINYNKITYFRIIRYKTIWKNNRTFAYFSVFSNSSIRCNIGVKFNPIFSSDLDTVGVRSNRLIDILTKLNGTTYLAVEGSRQYLEEDNFSKKIDLEVSFINLDHNPYEHVHNKEFIPNLSVVDMIASLGFEQTKKFLE